MDVAQLSSVIADLFEDTFVRNWNYPTHAVFISFLLEQRSPLSQARERGLFFGSS
jgi:hypothetical protein